ncbi:MAG: O-methyltransferase [Armatimonadota bacterium]
MSFRRIPMMEWNVTEEQAVDRALELLREDGFLEDGRVCDHGKFDLLRTAVRREFRVPWTSITPPMERLLYAINAAHRPKRFVGIGIYCGNTLIWNIGAAVGPGKCYTAEALLGVEIEPESAAIAAGNLERIGVLQDVELLVEDGHQTLDRIDGPIDLLYLDATGPLPGTSGPSTKLIYLSLLQHAYDKLRPGSLVLAHDTVPRWFVESAGAYLEFVRDPDHFRASVSLEPDTEGLEVSVR